MSNFPPPLPKQPRIKICGITRAEDGLLALELGADFIGVILTRKSPRYVPLDQAWHLVRKIRELAPAARIFGVFTTETTDEIAEALAELRLAALQIHAPVAIHLERLPLGKVVPAFSIRSDKDSAKISELPVGIDHVLVDTYSATAHGGTGQLFDHSLVSPLFAEHRLFVAGGISPDNVASVVSAFQGEYPYALDLNSGVEDSPGIKSPEKLQRFFEQFRNVIA